MNEKIEQDELNELASILNIRYASSLGERQFSFTADLDFQKDVAQVQVLLQNQDQSFYYPVDGRISAENHTLSLRECALAVIDFIEAYFGEYFGGDENVFLPIDWNDFSFEGIDFQLKGQVRNLKAEQMADELLYPKQESAH